MKAPLTMSIDVIFHLVEDDVFENYMKTLCGASSDLVLIYSSNDNKESGVSHIKHRKYTDWINQNRPEFSLIEEMANPYPYTTGSDEKITSFASFKLFKKAV